MTALGRLWRRAVNILYVPARGAAKVLGIDVKPIDIGSDRNNYRDIDNVAANAWRIALAVFGVRAISKNKNMLDPVGNSGSGKSGFFQELLGNAVDGLGAYFNNKQNNQAGVQNTQAVSSAISEGVKSLATIAVIGFVISIVVKLIFGRK